VTQKLADPFKEAKSSSSVICLLMVIINPIHRLKDVLLLWVSLFEKTLGGLLCRKGVRAHEKVNKNERKHKNRRMLVEEPSPFSIVIVNCMEF